MIIRITLDEEDFRRLVAGQIVEKPLLKSLLLRTIDDGQPAQAQIMLSDIGWARMSKAVVDAMGKAARAFLPSLHK